MPDWPPEELRMRLASGERADGAYPAAVHAELYSEIVHRNASGLVEVVAAERLGDGRLAMRPRRERGNYLGAGDREALRARCGSLASAGLEVFVTPAVLSEPEPGNEAVGEGICAWVDIDEEANVEKLRAFERRPHMVVVSGGSGGVHAYWRLAGPVGGETLERLNRTLAEAVGGDAVCANRGRIMRLPGSWNYKRDPGQACRVAMADLKRAGYEPEELVAGLEDPLERVPEPVRSTFTDPVAGELEAIAPPVYFARIAGIGVAERGGECRCPAPEHEDKVPTCHVYPEPGQGFYCFACGAGGGAVDLAALTLGLPYGRALRGSEFLVAKEKALRALGLAEEADALADRLARNGVATAA